MIFAYLKTQGENIFAMAVKRLVLIIVLFMSIAAYYYDYLFFLFAGWVIVISLLFSIGFSIIKPRLQSSLTYTVSSRSSLYINLLTFFLTLFLIFYKFNPLFYMKIENIKSDTTFDHVWMLFAFPIFALLCLFCNVLIAVSYFNHIELTHQIKRKKGGENRILGKIIPVVFSFCLMLLIIVIPAYLLTVSSIMWGDLIFTYFPWHMVP